MIRRLAVLSLVLSALGLSACGVRGSLERPPPVWGEDERSPAEREHETENEQDGGSR